MEIKNLEPRGIWQNFYLLTQVPRPSGHLEKIQAFLLKWAKEKNIEAFQDNAGNIIMRKPATPGFENLKMVTFEGHMDMVPQKAADSNHNFETDPIGHTSAHMPQFVHFAVSVSGLAFRNLAGLPSSPLGI